MPVCVFGANLGLLNVRRPTPIGPSKSEPADHHQKHQNLHQTEQNGVDQWVAGKAERVVCQEGAEGAPNGRASLQYFACDL